MFSEHVQSQTPLDALDDARSQLELLEVRISRLSVLQTEAIDRVLHQVLGYGLRVAVIALKDRCSTLVRHGKYADTIDVVGLWYVVGTVKALVSRALPPEVVQ